MVANMALPVKQPQHPSTRGGVADINHQYAWLLNADTGCKGMEGRSHGAIIQSSDECSSSWEARAFAEDASSLAAGIWPPRAYPCSFCRREFRSAQALGGHMNVHRRDRARLRHSSPPPPFCGTHNISLQPGTIIHKSQHGYSSTASLNPNACPDIIYPNGPLSKVPTALALSAISPQNSTACLAARCPSDMAASFPLRLHLLASEAASTLMRPQAQSSDLLSLWPASAIDSGSGCHSTIGTSTKGRTIDISSWSLSSSSSSSSSIVLNCGVTPSLRETPCRRARHDAPVILLEDESPKKKSNVASNSDFLPYQILKLKNPSKEEEISQAHGKQSSDKLGNVEEGMRMQHAAEARSDCVDLELRLGPRPP